MSDQWKFNLGIEVDFDDLGPWDLAEWSRNKTIMPLVANGWVADYPDPDDFLCRSVAITLLRYLGWQDADFDHLVEEAARTPDRARRMAMYRQADHLLVSDHTLVMIFIYSVGYQTMLVKPWVKNYSVTRLGVTEFFNFIIEDH